MEIWAAKSEPNPEPAQRIGAVELDVEAISIVARYASGDYYVRYANPQVIGAAATFGMNAYDIESLLSAFSKADCALARRLLAAAYTGDRPQIFTAPVPTSRGTRWLRIAMHPWKIDAVPSVLTLFQDVTAIKRRYDRELLLSHAIEQSVDGIALLEIPEADVAKRHWIYANDAACEILRSEREMLFESGAASIIFGDDQEAYDECAQVVTWGATWQRERYAHLPDGTYRWLYITIRPLVLSGGIISHWLMTFRDIDERKRSTKKIELLTSVLEQASDLLVATDAQVPSLGGPRITYANPAFADLLGARDEDLMGLPFASVISPDNDPKVTNDILNRLERHSAIAKEMRIRRHDDHTDRWIALDGIPMKGEGGAPRLWLFHGLDISIRKAQYTLTAQLVTALDHADEAIVIYSVHDGMSLEVEHCNRHAIAQGGSELEYMLKDVSRRVRIERLWGHLKAETTVRLLVHLPDADVLTSWLTLDLRPMAFSREGIESLIVTEHSIVERTSRERLSYTALALRLAETLLQYSTFVERTDAIEEVTHVLWDAKAVFERSELATTKSIRMESSGVSVIVPANRLDDKPTAIDLSWETEIHADRVTALRVFLETLAQA